MTARRNAIGAIGIAAATVATYFGWLGWDTEYQVDPVTQAESGPYEAWQVAGCVVTLLVLALVAGLVFLPWVVAPVMTVSFTVAWAVGAALRDESGLWLVGAIGVFVGMAIGSTIVSVPAWAVRRAFVGRRAAPAPQR
jgi:hypothetical protein